MRQQLSFEEKAVVKDKTDLQAIPLQDQPDSSNFGQYWDVLDIVDDMVIVVNPEFKVIRINRYFSQWLLQNGVDARVIGDDLFSISPFLRKGTQEKYLNALTAGERVFLDELMVRNNQAVAMVTYLVPILKNRTLAEIVILLREQGKSSTVEIPQFIDIVSRNNDRSIIIHDFSGQIVAWDKGAEKTYGFSEDEALRMNIDRITDPEDLGKYFQKISSLHDNAKSKTFEIQRKSKTNQPVYVWVTAKLIEDDNGNPYAVALTEYDVSELKRTRNALRDSEDKYKILTENISAGIYRSVPDDDSRFIEINPAALRMFGLKSRKEAENLRIVDLYVNPEDRKRFKEQMEKDGYVNRMECLLRRVDGSNFWCSITAVAHKDKKQNISYYDGILEDITEQKLSEYNLRESEKRYRDLIENLSVGILVLDGDFKILLANSAAQKILLDQTEDLTRYNLKKFVDKENLKRLYEYSQSEKKSPEQNCDLEIIQPEGHKRIISITFSPHIFQESKKVASLVTIRDVTNIRKMEEDVMKATKLESIGIFAGGVAHDFNNILTIVLGNLSLAKMFLTGDENIQKRLDKAEKAALRAKDLTQQLLMFSKEGMPIKKISSIKELIEESVNFSLTGSKIVCETLIPDGIWALEIDEGQISQSINNLIINAIQAMPEGGRILFSARNIVLKKDNKFRLKAGNYVRISIEDEGTGIPPENLSKIFDPYFTTKEKGNGLGLYSVYSIISKHDGAISVESTVGIGTKFNIFLPANSEVKIERKAESENILSGEGKILVMDDEEDILEVAQIMLKNLGYDVVTTKNGKEALELYGSALTNNHPFDAVIMDLTVRGGMGAKNVIKNLLAMDSNARVIVSSGYSNDPTMADYKHYGFKGLIMKPFKMKDLWKTLKNVIEVT